MDTSAAGTSIISRKRKRNEENEANFKEKIKIIVVSVIAMLMGVIAWYHEKYLVKEPGRNIDLEEPNSATKKMRQSSSSTITQSQRKRGEKDGIIASLREVAESLKEFVQATTKKTEEKDVKEMLNELEKIPDLDNSHWLKAIKWLIENPSQLVVVRALPLKKKKEYILAFMA